MGLVLLSYPIPWQTSTVPSHAIFTTLTLQCIAIMCISDNSLCIAVAVATQNPSIRSDRAVRVAHENLGKRFLLLSQNGHNNFIFGSLTSLHNGTEP